MAFVENRFQQRFTSGIGLRAQFAQRVRGSDAVFGVQGSLQQIDERGNAFFVVQLADGQGDAVELLFSAAKHGDELFAGFFVAERSDGDGGVGAHSRLVVEQHLHD